MNRVVVGRMRHSNRLDWVVLDVPATVAVKVEVCMKLWGRTSSFNVQKVLWFLEELGVDFDHEQIGGAHGSLHTERFLALNPLGKVPVLQDGETVIWESHAILRYLAASYGADRFWPASPAQRSWVDRWMDWAQTKFQADFIKLFWGFYRMPEDKRNLEQLAMIQKDCESEYRILAGELRKRPYLAGDEFSLADIPAGTSLYRYFEMGLDVERPPEVMAWYARLAQRPAFQTRIMIPFDELKGRETF